MSEVRVAAKSSPSPTTSQTRVRVAVAVFLGFFLGRIYSDVRLDVFIVQTESSDSSTSSIASSLHDGDTPCDSSGLSPIPSLLDKRSWIYDELSPAETRVAAIFAMQRLKIKSSMAGQASTGNSLSGTESVVLIPPNKKMARSYVAGDRDLPPPRFAKVAVVRGLVSPPDVMLYRIGPITGTPSEPHIDEAKGEVTPLTAPGDIPYAKRPYDVNDDTSIKIAIPELQKLKPFLVEFLGPIWDWLPNCPAGSECWDPAAGRSIVVPYNDITSSAISRISRFSINWYKTGENVQAQWLHELPLAFRTNQTGSNPSNWFVYDIMYCGHLQTFASASQLLRAWEGKTLKDCPFDKSSIDPKTNGARGNWDIPGLAPGANARPGSTLAPPKQTCSRRRFKLGADRGGNNGRLVSWLGWTFFATVRPATGLAVMDVRFKGKRIAHEIALSEAVAYYSGSGKDQVMYLDSAWSMTQLSAKLIPGVDCPADAAYINGTQMTFLESPSDGTGTTQVSRKATSAAAEDDSGEEDDIPVLDSSSEKGEMKARFRGRDITGVSAPGQIIRSDPTKAVPFKAACVFERDDVAALWRHTQVQAPGKARAGIRATTLVVRMVSTVDNYDYLTEFEFVPDGSIRIDLVFAGYCEVRWFNKDINPWERDLGEVAHAPGVAAPLHSHFGAFKIDLDVVNEKNSLEATRFKVGKPKGVPGLATYGTKFVTRSIVPREGIEASTANANTTTMWRIVNTDKSLRPPSGDAVDRIPGYAIAFTGTTARQTLPANHPMVRSTTFSKYNLAVTQRHESEQRVTSVYDLFGQMSPPIVSLDKYLEDKESIDEEDIVAWVTIAKEHLPRTEDVPVVTDFGVGFHLIPWNLLPVNGATQDMP
jgi:hypothetical protein|eukprot:g1062.t1